MNILELKPSDFAGAIAHVAASQLFAFLNQGEDDEPDDTSWYGSSPSAEQIEKDVLAMSRYVNGRSIPAEQLWRWTRLQGITLSPGDEYIALPIPQRLAFEIFTDVCMTAHHRVELVQLDEKKLIPFENAPAAGLKLEDSIFEPHGSLGDQDPHQKQFLDDQRKYDEQLLEESRAAEAGDTQEQPAFTAGAPIDNQEPEKPASMSVGTQEGGRREKEDADPGQGESGQAPADTDAQGDISDLVDDGAAEQLQTSSEGASAGAGELAPAVSQQPGQAGHDNDGEMNASETESPAAADPGNDIQRGAGDNVEHREDAQQSAHQGGAEAVGDGDGEAAGKADEPTAAQKAPVKPKKPAKGKSPS